MFLNIDLNVISRLWLLNNAELMVYKYYIWIIFTVYFNTSITRILVFLMSDNTLCEYMCCPDRMNWKWITYLRKTLVNGVNVLEELRGRQTHSNCSIHHTSTINMNGNFYIVCYGTYLETHLELIKLNLEHIKVNLIYVDNWVRDSQLPDSIAYVEMNFRGKVEIFLILVIFSLHVFSLIYFNSGSYVYKWRDRTYLMCRAPNLIYNKKCFILYKDV